MSQTSTDRLRDYLAQLPPQSQALLMRQFERAIERGEDTAVATFVLEQLRKIVRGTDEAARPRADDPARIVFHPLEPFLIDGQASPRPGQIRRASLQPVWQWLVREGAPEQARELDQAFRDGAAGNSSRIELAARKLQLAAADAIFKIAIHQESTDQRRALSRIGPPEMIEDLIAIASVLQAREAFDTLDSRLPSYMRIFGEPQIVTASAALNVPSLQTPQMLPFALSLVMRRLTAPWQIIRLAVRMAASDDELRVAATP